MAACGIAGCSMGYANCQGDGTNCLTYIGGTDVNNCGACGHKCTTANGTPKRPAASAASAELQPGPRPLLADGHRLRDAPRHPHQLRELRQRLHHHQRHALLHPVGHDVHVRDRELQPRLHPLPGGRHQLRDQHQHRQQQLRRVRGHVLRGDLRWRGRARRLGQLLRRQVRDHLLRRELPGHRPHVLRRLRVRALHRPHHLRRRSGSTWGRSQSRRRRSPAVTHSSNLFPATPNAAYYAVTFTANTDTNVPPEDHPDRPAQRVRDGRHLELLTLSSSACAATSDATNRTASPPGTVSYGAEPGRGSDQLPRDGQPLPADRGRRQRRHGVHQGLPQGRRGPSATTAAHPHAHHQLRRPPPMGGPLRGPPGDDGASSRRPHPQPPQPGPARAMQERGPTEGAGPREGLGLGGGAPLLPLLLAPAFSAACSRRA